MIEGLQPYAEYEESERRWLGKVPGHWLLQLNRAIFYDKARQVVQTLG